MEHPASRPIRCPRCGYDLRGAVATWRTSCPLAGPCTECGLDVRWAEVLRPEKFEPRWSVEHAPGRYGMVRGFVPTLLRSCWPFGFFRALKMSDPIRPGRLLRYLVLLVALTGVCYAWSQGTLAGFVRYRIALQRDIVAVDHPYPIAIAEAVFVPFGETSAGTLTTSAGAAPAPFPYPGPRDLRQMAVILRPTGPAGWFSAESIIPVVYVWGFGSMLYLLMPVCFVLLPISRRRAKVRWAHVWRVAAYSLAVPSLTAGAAFLAMSVGWIRHEWLDTIAAIAALAMFGGLPLGLLCWWGAATSRYMHIPRGWLVAVVLTVLSLLLLPFVAGALWVIGGGS